MARHDDGRRILEVRYLLDRLASAVPSRMELLLFEDKGVGFVVAGQMELMSWSFGARQL